MQEREQEKHVPKYQYLGCNRNGGGKKMEKRATGFGLD